MSNMRTRSCQLNRKRQKAENLNSAERVKYGKPLRAKPGVLPQSKFVTPQRGDYVRHTDARNHSTRL